MYFRPISFRTNYKYASVDRRNIYNYKYASVDRRNIYHSQVISLITMYCTYFWFILISIFVIFTLLSSSQQSFYLGV
jgi:hypothetical protein